MKAAQIMLLHSFLSAIPAVAFPPLAGHYAVKNDTYDLGGFLCGSQAPTVRVYYPAKLNKGPFPIVTFGHGLGGAIPPNLLESVVSLGMVLVAPDTHGGRCEDNEWRDMLHAIAGSKANQSLHESLRHVDWSRAGVMGHSMGGLSTTFAVAEALKEPNKYNVKAGVDSHGYLHPDLNRTATITVPMMYVTGNEDIRGRLCEEYEASPGLPKVLAMVDGAGHYEPRQGGRLNPFHAHFLGCHVAGLESSCEKVYGDSADTLCKANKMHICEVNRSTSDLRLPSELSIDIPMPSNCTHCFTTQCHLPRDMASCEPCVREHNCRCKKDCGRYSIDDSVASICKQPEITVV